MKQSKFLRFAVLGALILGATSSARAQGGMPDLSDFGGAIEKKSVALAAQKPAPNAGVFQTSLSVPTVKPGAAASALIHQMRLKIEELDKANPGVAKPEFIQGYADLEKQMPQILLGIEAEMTKQKLAKRDMGVAAGLVFTTLWETANDREVGDKADGVAIRAMASVADQAWAPKWKTLAPADKEKLYENLLMSAAFQSLMAGQFKEAGKTEDETGFRESAAAMFETLVGVPPSQVEIAPDGQISGMEATDAAPTDAPNDGAPTADEMAQ